MIVGSVTVFVCSGKLRGGRDFLAGRREVPREPKEKMFPGYLSDSQLLQDIRENYRPQTLVSVPGFTAKHQMFVPPLASRRAASPSLSTQAPHALALPASSQSRQESASSSSTTSHGADETATARFVPSWVTYHGVVRSGFEFLWLCFWSSIEPRRSLLNHPPDFPILFHPSIHPFFLSFASSHLAFRSPGAVVQGGPRASGRRRDRAVPSL